MHIYIYIYIPVPTAVPETLQVGQGHRVGRAASPLRRRAVRLQ